MVRALDVCIYVEMKKTRSLTTTVFFLISKYTVVTRYRDPGWGPLWIDCTTTLSEQIKMGKLEWNGECAQV